MIKMYVLMTLMSGTQAYWDKPGFMDMAECNRAADKLVTQKMSTGRYENIEAMCGLDLGFEI